MIPRFCSRCCYLPQKSAFGIWDSYFPIKGVWANFTNMNICIFISMHLFQLQIMIPVDRGAGVYCLFSFLFYFEFSIMYTRENKNNEFCILPRQTSFPLSDPHPAPKVQCYCLDVRRNYSASVFSVTVFIRCTKDTFLSAWVIRNRK